MLAKSQFCLLKVRKQTKRRKITQIKVFNYKKKGSVRETKQNYQFKVFKKKRSLRISRSLKIVASTKASKTRKLASFANIVQNRKKNPRPLQVARAFSHDGQLRQRTQLCLAGRLQHFSRAKTPLTKIMQQQSSQLLQTKIERLKLFERHPSILF